MSDFVDLRPGTTVTVVIPILRSGGYILPSLRAQTPSSDGRIEAGADFVGYERDFYSVKPDGNGVRVRFNSGELWQNGKSRKIHAPRVSVFQGVAGNHVRLVFLTRVSKADHDMAIVSSSDLARLETITLEVTARAECHSGTDASCAWVPNGIAVRPE